MATNFVYAAIAAIVIFMVVALYIVFSSEKKDARSNEESKRALRKARARKELISLQEKYYKKYGWWEKRTSPYLTKGDIVFHGESISQPYPNTIPAEIEARYHEEKHKIFMSIYK